MSKPMADIDEVVEGLEMASRMISRMCADGTPPKMSIPARPDHDEDLLIVKAHKDAITLIRELEARVPTGDPVAWKVFDGEGNDDLFLAEFNEWCARDAAAHKGTQYESWYTPLYAPKGADND